ncbi:MAG: nitroreductase/quinone reductase family protein [Thaumarchaeota archaeon]|nr:nitroreductase/quinone reductase family protein [Nitrososphaerota archaeon]
MSSGQYLRIETTGRKTGKHHQVLVRYIADKDRIVAFPQNAGKQDWVKNIEANPEIKVYYNDSITSATGAVKEITGLNDPLLPIFTRKYGRSTINRWYKGQHLFVEIAVKKELGSISYDEIIYGDLEAAFDSVAAHYDHHIFDNPINTWLRNVSIGTMVQMFKPGETVLEVGCGTGTETLSLARHGLRIIATDISEKMLEVLSKKAARLNLSDRIIPVHCRPTELRAKLHDLGYEKVDGAYSTYGAINTEPNLHSMIDNLHSVLKPSSLLLLGVWNKFCLYEMVGYLLRLNPSLAFARLRNPVPVGKSRFCVASNAFSVGDLNELVKNRFVLQRVLGVVVTLPPSNLTRYLPRGRGFGIAKKIDLDLGAGFPLNRLGDHFLGIYRRI